MDNPDSLKSELATMCECLREEMRAKRAALEEVARWQRRWEALRGMISDWATKWYAAGAEQYALALWAVLDEAHAIEEQ
jgi:hypothetical protein